MKIKSWARDPFEVSIISCGPQVLFKNKFLGRITGKSFILLFSNDSLRGDEIK
jgi:hypothetical protein